MSTKQGKSLHCVHVDPRHILASSWAMAGGNDKPAPLVIQEQGSFAVGGTVSTNPGTFDPIKCLLKDKHSTAITPMCLTRFR